MANFGLVLADLHGPGVRTRVPARGSHADKVTGAALALIAVMRAAPDQLELDETVIDPETGMVTITVLELHMARALAAVLGLPAARHVTELDDSWILRRWSGEWADWPITIHHTYRDDDTSHGTAGWGE